MQNGFVLPIVGMALLTFGIGIRMLQLRLRAVKEKKLSPAYFLFSQGGNPPEELLKVTRHYDNLFEMPVLFYTVTILISVLNKIDIVFVILAWLYFILRIVHAIIHITDNHLIRRRNAFLASTAVLAAMWVKLLIQLMAL